MPKPSLKAIIKFKKTVGTEAVYIDGLPGSGKSVLGHHLGTQLLMEKNALIMRGSAACEWRHFYNVEAAKEIQILIQTGMKDEIFYRNVPEEVKDDIHEVDFHTIDIQDYIKPEKVLVLYDECYPMAQRCWLITDMLRQLMYRTKNDLDDVPITYLEHEAGIVYPMTALADKKDNKSNKHWHAVNEACHQFVDYRKFWIRPIMIAQLSREFTDLMRDKCTFKIYKQGKASTSAPENVKKNAPFQAINKYTIVVGDAIYRTDRTINKFPETKKQWKMIPLKMSKYKCRAEREEDKKPKAIKGYHLTARESFIVKCRLEGMSYGKIAILGHNNYGFSKHKAVSYEGYIAALSKLDEKTTKIPLVIRAR